MAAGADDIEPDIDPDDPGFEDDEGPPGLAVHEVLQRAGDARQGPRWSASRAPCGGRSRQA
eukprot:9354718-Alexandrium_andersonii.AAC.1